MEYLVVLMCAVISVVSCCTMKNVHTSRGPDDLSFAEQFTKADAVIMGIVREHQPDPSYKNLDSAYAFKVEVLCSYKGGRFPQEILISGGGNISGCPNVNAEIADVNADYPDPYIFILKKNAADDYEMEFSEVEGLFVDEFQSICGSNAIIPEGISLENADPGCENLDDVTDDSCARWVPPTPPPKVDSNKTMTEDKEKENTGNGEQQPPYKNGDGAKPTRDNGSSRPDLALYLGSICALLVALLI